MFKPSRKAYNLIPPGLASNAPQLLDLSLIPLCASHAYSEINAEAKEWSWFCLGQNRGFGTRVREPEQTGARSFKGMYLRIHREDRTGTLERSRIEVSHDYQKRVVYPRKHRFLLMLPDLIMPSHLMHVLHHVRFCQGPKLIILFFP